MTGKRIKAFIPLGWPTKKRTFRQSAQVEKKHCSEQPLQNHRPKAVQCILMRCTTQTRPFIHFEENSSRKRSGPQNQQGPHGNEQCFGAKHCPRAPVASAGSVWEVVMRVFLRVNKMTTPIVVRVSPRGIGGIQKQTNTTINLFIINIHQ